MIETECGNLESPGYVPSSENLFNTKTEKKPTEILLFPSQQLAMEYKQQCQLNCSSSMSSSLLLKTSEISSFKLIFFIFLGLFFRLIYCEKLKGSEKWKGSDLSIFEGRVICCLLFIILNL